MLKILNIIVVIRYIEDPDNAKIPKHLFDH